MGDAKGTRRETGGAVDRPFDVAVLGASGVTGREIVRYLAGRAHERELRWCVAGRDADRLRRSLDAVDAVAPVVEVDLDEPRALRSLVESSAVVVNAVGPYPRFGTLVHRSCAVSGTHHVDLCVDVEVLRAVIDECEAPADRSGAQLVHSAGFLSLPFDLATAFAAERCAREVGSPLVEIDVAVTVRVGSPIVGLGDVVSGGTLAGSADAIRRGGAAVPQDARYLVAGPHEPLLYDRSAREHRGTGGWLGPMLPSPHINPVIVHRSASVAPADRIASGFRFRDGLASAGLVPGVPDSFTAAWMAGAHVLGSMIGMAPASVRNLVADTVQAFGPRPGAGPGTERLDAWSWRLDCCATSQSGETFLFDVEGRGHLGYRSSADLAAEAALLLVDEPGGRAAGVLTPAMAFGGSIPRFERAGLVFSAVRQA